MVNLAKDPIVVTTHIKKGGTGKTTITYNGAFFLAIKKDLKKANRGSLVIFCIIIKL